MFNRKLTCVLALALSLVTSPVWGDVTIKRTTTSDGLGGLLRSTTTSTESISGDMMASDSETKMDNKLMKMFGGGKSRTTTIARLDKEVMWTVDHKDKSYTEMTFAEMRAMLDSLGTMASSGMAQMVQQQPTIDTSEITFSEPQFSVNKTGKRETIAGYGCEQVIMTMTTEGTNRKTGETIKLEVTTDMMMAKNVPGSDEIIEFSKRLAGAMGFEMDKGSASSMTKMLEMYGIDADRLAEESKKMDGFAMKTVMSFSMGGDAMAQAQAQSEANKANSEGEESAEEGGGTPTDASGIAAKALGGLFGKKDKKKDDEKKDNGVADAPPGALLWMTSTVTGIESGAAPAETYEVPASYKLKKSPMQKN